MGNMLIQNKNLNSDSANSPSKNIQNNYSQVEEEENIVDSGDEEDGKQNQIMEHSGNISKSIKDKDKTNI